MRDIRSGIDELGELGLSIFGLSFYTDRSRHDKVKQSIESLASKGIIPFPQSEENPTSGSGGRPGTHYKADKLSCYIVVTQLSPEFTAALVDHWQELENNLQQSAL